MLKWGLLGDKYRKKRRGQLSSKKLLVGLTVIHLCIKDEPLWLGSQGCSSPSQGPAPPMGTSPGGHLHALRGKSPGWDWGSEVGLFALWTILEWALRLLHFPQLLYPFYYFQLSPSLFLSFRHHFLIHLVSVLRSPGTFSPHRTSPFISPLPSLLPWLLSAYVIHFHPHTPIKLHCRPGLLG